MASQERRRVDPRAAGGARRSTGSCPRSTSSRSRAPQRRFTGVAVVPGLGRRAARRRARRVRARGATATLVERGRARGASLRAARAHRGRALDLAATAARGPPASRAGSAPTSCATGSPAPPASSARTRRARSVRALDRGAASPAMRAWLAERADAAALSRHAKLREIETHVVGPMCHVLWALDDRRRRRAEHDDAQQLRAEHGFVMERAPVKPQRAILEANMGGDKKPSHRYFERGGHGKTVDRRGDAHRRGDPRASCARRPTISRRSPSPARTAPSPRGCSRSRSRPRRRSRRSSPRPARTSAWSGRARWRTAPAAASTAASTSRSASPASRSAPSAAGRRSRTRATGSALMGCAGAGQGLPLRADRRGRDARARDLRLGRDGDRRLGELLPGAPRARRPPLK